MTRSTNRRRRAFGKRKGTGRNPVRVATKVARAEAHSNAVRASGLASREIRSTLPPETTDNPAAELRRFLKDYRIVVLNVAGPIASKEPEVYDFVKSTLDCFAANGDTLGAISS